MKAFEFDNRLIDSYANVRKAAVVQCFLAKIESAACAKNGRHNQDEGNEKASSGRSHVASTSRALVLISCT